QKISRYLRASPSHMVGCSARVLAAAKPDLVEPKLRPVGLVGAAAACPGLRPVTALERRSIGPLRPGRLHPLLDVAGEVMHAVHARAAGVRARGLALPGALDLGRAHRGVARAEARLAHGAIGLVAVAGRGIVSPAVGPG